MIRKNSLSSEVLTWRDMQLEIARLRQDMQMALMGANAGERALRKMWFGQEGSNYGEFDSHGMLRFYGTGTAFDDLYAGFETSKIPGANTPTWGGFQGNLNAYSFAVNDYLEPDCTELMHRYRNGSNFEVHVHWATNGLDITDRYVRWEVEYTIANTDPADAVGDAFPATTTIAAETTIPANTPTLTNMYTDVGIITGTDFLFGALFKCRVRRIAALGGAAPTSNPFGLMLGLHVECNSIGSDTVTTK